MANRHLSRSIVMQTLFEWDFNGARDENIPAILDRNVKELAPGLPMHAGQVGAGDVSFMETLVKNILSKRKTLDEIIEKAAPEWPINRISITDRNVLRIGLYELLFGDKDEVPPKVAINEAIELAKTFGGENSGKFVNGVLGAVYKELGEPGKDETSKDKKNNVGLNAIVPVEHLGGAVVYARDGEDVYLALVHDVFGRWTLSKGHIEGKNTENEVKVAVKDELGIDMDIKEKLGENEYIAYHPEKGKLKKHVTYFLAEAKFGELHLKAKGGLDDAKWFKLADILDLNFYNDILPLVTKAINMLLKK